MITVTAALGAAGCEGVNPEDELGYERPPPTSGRIDVNVGGGGGNCSGSNCSCTSGSCTSGVADGGVTDGFVSGSDSGTADSGGFDAGTTDTGVADSGPSLTERTFEYRDSSASSVWVTGNFVTPVWAETPAEGALELTKQGGDLWSASVMLEDGRYEYKFIVNGSAWVADPANPGQGPDGNSVFVIGDGNNNSGSCGDLEAFDWRDAVMYFAMIDRFADGDSSNNQPVSGASGGDATNGPSGQYEGGDLKGLKNRIPYLADLGVTALWMSAPYENRNSVGAAIDPGSDSHGYSGYHGYWPSPPAVDYSNPNNPSPAPQVESRIGTSQDLKAVIDAAHSSASADGHGMKVLFDYVMNHVDIDSGLYQAHPDWFARDNGRFRLCGPENLWNDPTWGTKCAFTDYLPPFDYGNATARAWSIADAIYWAKAYGIDGYRLDAIKHVPLVWLTDLRSALKQQFPDPEGGRFYLVGETFDYGNRDLLKSFVDPDRMLDGQFDFPFKRVACESLFRGDGNIANLANFMQGNDDFYGPGSLMTTWIGNHDIPRAIHFASHQIGSCTEGSNAGNGWSSSYGQPGDAAAYERLGLAFAVMMTNPGIPLIYYGDEVGLAGGGDPDNRRMMPWSDSSINAHQKALRAEVKRLAHIRAENKVLGRGRRTTLYADQNVWAYRMSGCGDGASSVVIAINKADSSQSVEIAGGPFTDLKSGGQVAGGRLSLPPRGYIALRE
ncbi:MAG: hypothetical protein IPK13_14310 [Deltaproteobacteria bacterium]|nr:hypothetical protein [Deltaproteobacteria bacterium]